MLNIKLFEKDDIQKVVAYENELRKQEPNTYYWKADEAYVKQLENSFEDDRFNTAISLLACKDKK